MPDVVAVPLSEYAVRFHAPNPDDRHRAWCGVRAAVVQDLDWYLAEDLEPCGICWPDVEPTLTPWDIVQRQCRLWDAVGAWEGDPGCTTWGKIVT
jgi:hypothetical protein